MELKKKLNDKLHSDSLSFWVKMNKKRQYAKILKKTGITELRSTESIEDWPTKAK